MLHDFKLHVDYNLKFLNNSKFLVAVSGGIDSIVLTHLCKQANYNFAIAHCNFNLRGDESDADELFINDLGESLNVEVFVQHFDTLNYSELNGVSIQMAARTLRYEWFNDLSTQLNFKYILTAHHLDDSLETFIINLSRGTGIEGLLGIPSVNDNIVRPLLPFTRSDIESFAKDFKLAWREDRSNASTKYLRNKIRHNIIPELKIVNPKLIQNFKKTINYLNDTSDLIELAMDDFIDSAITKVNDFGVHYDIDCFKSKPNSKPFLYHTFNSYGFTQWDDILSLLDAQPGKYVQSDSHRLLKDRNELILSELLTTDQKGFEISSIDSPVTIPSGVLHFSVETSPTNTKSLFSICLDLDKLCFPLNVRLSKPGDYFYPSGMEGRKKVSKYFKDEKMSLLEKEHTWLLTSEDKVVWIIGKRFDKRFLWSNSSDQCLTITLI